MTMTCIYILAGVLFLSALAESAVVDRWEYREVYLQKYNETIKDLQELEALLKRQDMDYCCLCKWIVEAVKHGIGDDRNPGLIRQLLHYVCEFFQDRHDCKVFLNSVFNTLVRLLSKTTDNAPLICHIVDACA